MRVSLFSATDSTGVAADRHSISSGATSCPAVHCTRTSIGRPHVTSVAKSDPAVIVARILDDLEADEDEAIADDISGQVQSILPGITAGILPQ
jgi:hypothetical protein